MVGFFVFMLSFFLTNVVPFDFRGDLDRLAVLKTLPIPTWRLALGQVLTPVLLVTALQWLVLLMVALSGKLDGGWGGREALMACAVFSPVCNLLLFGLENLLFLLFPTRLASRGGPADLQAVGRNMLFYLAKLFSLMLAGGLAAVVGLLVGVLTGRVLAGFAAAWLTIALTAAAVVPLVAVAFDHFDVGRDTPPG